MSQILYVVLASEGEYSDREVWVAGVFSDEATAQHLVEETSARFRVYEQARLVWGKKFTEQAYLRDPFGRMFLAWSPNPSFAGVDTKEAEAKWRAAFAAANGPPPEWNDGEQFEVVAVPLGEWGKYLSSKT